MVSDEKIPETLTIYKKIVFGEEFKKINKNSNKWIKLPKS